MAQKIPLQSVPNQMVTARLDGARYEIALKAAGTVMVADITRDGVPLVTGMRCLAGTPLLPYRHLWQGKGNFVFLTSDDAAPWWESFDMQVLVYQSGAEL